MAHAIEASLWAERLAREAAATAAAAAPAPAPAPASAASGASSPLGEPMDWSPLGSHPLDLEPTPEPSPAPSPRTPRTPRRRSEKGALRSCLCLRCARAALASNAGDTSCCYNNDSSGICYYKCAFGHNCKPLEHQLERSLAAPALPEPAMLEAALAVFSRALVATIY
ncbi:hypothetical protein E8E12_000437 [Didymella heteroderae]|uniref:Uncharacterized protein n=1 Tax=Didymella heteroderae TaxID=1769908 RepID=A0A9P5BV30_9PLEO|nr:hypothetical protein E8E12_000437 [Didymella heteroderae]